MSILGVILGRGGSRRLPGKNLLPLCGRPMIAWTIRAAQWSRLDAMVVSSDSEEILNVARLRNVMAIRRPDELATDTASPYDAIRHAYGVVGEDFDFICLLQPTSPLRAPLDIDACAELMSNTHLPCVVSFEDDCPIPNGAVYIGRTDWLLSGGNFDIGPAVRYSMPPERSVDVNTLHDFERAATLMLAYV